MFKRRTAYQYSDDASLLAGTFLRVVTGDDVCDALADNDYTNDVLKAKTIYTYDDYAIKGGMEILRVVIFELSSQPR